MESSGHAGGQETETVPHSSARSMSVSGKHFRLPVAERGVHSGRGLTWLSVLPCASPVVRLCLSMHTLVLTSHPSPTGVSINACASRLQAPSCSGGSKACGCLVYFEKDIAQVMSSAEPCASSPFPAFINFLYETLALKSHFIVIKYTLFSYSTPPVKR